MASNNFILSDIQRMDTYYFACGSLADLYEGQWTSPSGEVTPVAIKVIRRYTPDDKMVADRACRKFLLEAHLWTQYHHPNIVPFYGLTLDKDFLGLVMPYYKNDNILEFLRGHPGASRLDMIKEIVAGLKYLHTLKPNPIIHGDIKASNIMITDDHRACLTNVGVSSALSVSGYTTTSLCGKSCRWMSPEILEEHGPTPTLASDIWALAMTILQIYTGKIPFLNLQNNATVIMSLSEGHLPQQPLEITDAIWALLKCCRKTEPAERPSASTMSAVLNVIPSQRLTTKRVYEFVDQLLE